MKILRLALLLLATVPILVAVAASPRVAGTWSPAEIAVIKSLSLDRLPPLKRDPSNAAEGNAAAITLGQQLFFDARLSRNGAVSCASCHDPGKGFQDGRPVGQGIATGRRRSMPIVDASYSPWMFWDGRKDSLWSQALGPLEDAAEHGGNRLAYVRQLATHYAKPYAEAFGPLPELMGMPNEASPLGTLEQRQAWAAIKPDARHKVNRAFSNIGKAIAAYESTLQHSATRFDRYVHAVETGALGASDMLTPTEVAGLRVFIGRGQCVSCHSGPLMTDQAFHNTGVPNRPGAALDHGRRIALAQVVDDEFNCLGAYSDANAEACTELEFIPKDDATLEGAFKTPSLRGVTERAPFMHAGQFATIEDVIHHYMQAPQAAVGKSELASRPSSRGRAPIRLSAHDVYDLTAFLATLSPVKVTEGTAP